MSALILALLFRKEKALVPKGAERTVVIDFVPTVFRVGMICLLIGASANIADIGILRKEGDEVKTEDFTRIGFLLL